MCKVLLTLPPSLPAASCITTIICVVHQVGQRTLARCRSVGAHSAPLTLAWKVVGERRLIR